MNVYDIDPESIAMLLAELFQRLERLEQQVEKLLNKDNGK